VSCFVAITIHMYVLCIIAYVHACVFERGLISREQLLWGWLFIDAMGRDRLGLY